MIVVLDAAPVLVAVWLMVAALYGLATTRDLLHTVLCVAVLHSAAWLLLVGVGYAEGTTAPIVDGTDAGQVHADPLVQALTVTDVVVGVAVSALLLACVVRIYRRFGSLDPADLDVLRG